MLRIEHGAVSQFLKPIENFLTKQSHDREKHSTEPRSKGFGRKRKIHPETVFRTIPAVYKTGTEIVIAPLIKGEYITEWTGNKTAYPRRFYMGSGTRSIVPNNPCRVENGTG